MINVKQKGNTMNIDFSKMNEGDTVRFKSGGEAVIEGISGKGKYHGSYGLIFQGCEGDFQYSPDGRIGTMPTGSTPFDIVEIIPKPYDWNNVRAGDAFVHKEVEGVHSDLNGKLIRFIGISPTNKSDVFEIDHNLNGGKLSLNWMPKRENLIYRPEYNLPLS